MSAQKERANAVFGHGSLMLPHSLVSRFTELEDEDLSIEEMNEAGISYGDEGITRETAEEVWQELKEDVEVIPVKVYGFQRSYSVRSKHGGTMLTAEHTGNEDDFINGVIYAGLEDEHLDEINEDESPHDTREVHIDSAESYLDEPLEDAEVELPETFQVYVGGDTEKFDAEGVPKNETYHGRVLKGIEILEELYDEAVAEEFLEDFMETTYESHPLEDGEVTLEESPIEAYRQWVNGELDLDHD